MPTITTKLQDKTHKILDQFIKDIAHLSVNNDLEHIALLRRTDILFSALQELGKEEFAKIFIVHNFTSSDVKTNEKYQTVLNCLLAAVIAHYSQTELLRYFLPEHLSQKEIRPEYSNSSSIFNYLFKLIGYWWRQQLDKPSYALLTPEHSEFANSIEQLKTSLNKETYLVNNVNDAFKQHLTVLREKVQEKTISPFRNEISRTNAINDEDYHQQLLDQEKELQGTGETIKALQAELEKEKAELKEGKELLRNEVIVNQGEKLKNTEEASNNVATSKMLLEERKDFNKQSELLTKKLQNENQELITLRENLEVLAEESKALKTQNLSLETQLNDLDPERAFKLFCEKHGSNRSGATTLSFISFLESRITELEAQVRYSENNSSEVPATNDNLISFSDSDPLLSTSSHKTSQASQASQDNSNRDAVVTTDDLVSLADPLPSTSKWWGFFNKPASENVNVSHEPLKPVISHSQ